MANSILWTILMAFLVGNAKSRSIESIISRSQEIDQIQKRDWTDPEIGATAMDIIKHWGYPVEEYNVTTEDGYVLLLLRIPHGRYQNSTSTKPRPVVYMQHGLESSCMDWIINLPTQSAAYLFADQGFDVWLGNFRGNFYSKGHVKYNNKQHEYWKFSWDEMALYDLPAMIKTALSVSGAESVYYMGHSMGTTTIMAKLAKHPEFGKYIKKVYALAPVATVTHLEGPSSLLAKLSTWLQRLLNFFGIDDLFPTTKLQDDLARYLCGSVITEKLVCRSILVALAGPESKQLNETRMPVYVSHTPSGTSTRTVIHFAQVAKAKKFQMYDFGSKQINKQRYNTETPPIYDVSKIQTRIGLYWGGQDWLADPQDVEALSTELRYLDGNYYFPQYNHIDFIWGLGAAAEIYKPIRTDISQDFVTVA